MSDLAWLPTDDQGRLLPRVEVRFWPGGRAYSYAWGGDGDLALGDFVTTPPVDDWQGPRLPVARVVALGSRYEGPVKTITERAR